MSVEIVAEQITWGFIVSDAVEPIDKQWEYVVSPSLTGNGVQFCRVHVVMGAEALDCVIVFDPPRDENNRSAVWQPVMGDISVSTTLTMCVDDRQYIEVGMPYPPRTGLAAAAAAIAVYSGTWDDRTDFLISAEGATFDAHVSFDGRLLQALVKTK